MNQNELRIGNYLNGKQGHVLVTEIRANNMVKIHGNTSSFYVGICLKPIPLTEEWLLKFGFITFDSKQIYNEWFLNFDGILKYKIFHSKYTGVEEFTMPHSDKPIKLKHVHQLQNLYFALTGEELTFKPE